MVHELVRYMKSVNMHGDKIKDIYNQSALLKQFVAGFLLNNKAAFVSSSSRKTFNIIHWSSNYRFSMQTSASLCSDDELYPQLHN